MNIIITDKQYRTIVEESIKENKLNETVQNLKDNFDDIAKLLDFSDDDKFYYIEIKTRFKDNRGIPKTDNFDGFGIYRGVFKVKSAQELLSLKPKIIQICNQYNARAYITQNPRSESAIQAFSTNPKFLKSMKYRNKKATPEQVLAGQAKSPYDKQGNKIYADAQTMENAFGSDRSNFLIDVDTKDKDVWQLVRILLKNFGFTTYGEKETPSGGLHILVRNAFSDEIPNLIKFCRIADSEIDNRGNRNFFPDKRMHQTIGIDFDGKLNLYSNVKTNGY